jgi:hypothetical protein
MQNGIFGKRLVRFGSANFFALLSTAPHHAPKRQANCVHSRSLQLAVAPQMMRTPTKANHGKAD